MNKTELHQMIRHLTETAAEAAHNLEIIKELQQYPDLPLLLSRAGEMRGISIPITERQNILHFCRTIWESEQNRINYFTEKYKNEIREERLK